MEKFIAFLESRPRVFSPTRRHFVILDGYKFHVILDVIIKAKHHKGIDHKGIDLFILPLMRCNL